MYKKGRTYFFIGKEKKKKKKTGPRGTIVQGNTAVLIFST